MRIIPAIDIIEGKCVRLSKGDYDTKIIYNENKLKIMRENMRQIKLNINDRVILEIMDKVLVEVA